jgi:hypothetical protein
VDVVLAFSVAIDRSDLVGLDDELGLELLHGSPCLLGRALVWISDSNKGCHRHASLVSDVERTAVHASASTRREFLAMPSI